MYFFCYKIYLNFAEYNYIVKPFKKLHCHSQKKHLNNEILILQRIKYFMYCFYVFERVCPIHI